MARKTGIAPLLIAGIAAFGAYKYSQMSETQKNNLKNKGKKFFDDDMGGLKNMFGKTNNQTRNSFNTQS